MHTIAHGVDLVENARFASLLDRHPERARRRLFTEAELAYASGKREIEHLAARFAAKEAVLKALGTGWADGIAWTDVEVTRARQRSAGCAALRSRGRDGGASGHWRLAAFAKPHRAPRDGLRHRPRRVNTGGSGTECPSSGRISGFSPRPRRPGPPQIGPLQPALPSTASTPGRTRPTTPAGRSPTSQSDVRSRAAGHAGQ